MPVVRQTVRAPGTTDHRTPRAVSQRRSQHRRQRGCRVPAVQRGSRTHGPDRLARTVPTPTRMDPSGESAGNAAERVEPRIRQRGWTSPRQALPVRPAAALPTRRLLRDADRGFTPAIVTVTNSFARGPQGGEGTPRRSTWSIADPGVASGRSAAGTSGLWAARFGSEPAIQSARRCAATPKAEQMNVVTTGRLATSSTPDRIPRRRKGWSRPVPLLPIIHIMSTNGSENSPPGSNTAPRWSTPRVATAEGDRADGGLDPLRQRRERRAAPRNGRCAAATFFGATADRHIRDHDISQTIRPAVKIYRTDPSRRPCGARRSAWTRPPPRCPSTPMPEHPDGRECPAPPATGRHARPHGAPRRSSRRGRRRTPRHL
ncbi:hypothetical protein AIIKEEIJ_00588 [Rhodococcus sp. YH1]|nr:hypothetical protein [Rhodococcus sp. YH1]